MFSPWREDEIGHPATSSTNWANSAEGLPGARRHLRRRVRHRGCHPLAAGDNPERCAEVLARVRQLTGVSPVQASSGKTMICSTAVGNGMLTRPWIDRVGPAPTRPPSVRRRREANRPRACRAGDDRRCNGTAAGEVYRASQPDVPADASSPRDLGASVCKASRAASSTAASATRSPTATSGATLGTNPGTTFRPRSSPRQPFLEYQEAARDALRILTPSAARTDD